LKKSGSFPKSISMNCLADIGVPSGCQNVVQIMCWMVRSLPSASFTLILSRLPSLDPDSRAWTSPLGRRGSYTRSFGSGSSGSPSHAGSLK
jgi:hypothetical protein